MWYSETEQYLWYGSPRKREREAERTFKEIMSQIDQMWWKAWIYTCSSEQNNVKETYIETHNKLSKAKDKEKILKAATEKWLIAYNGSWIRLLGDFSSEPMEARKQWADIFKVLKVKMSTKNSVCGELSFNNEGDIKMFLDKQKPREFIGSASPAMLKSSSRWNKKTLYSNRKPYKEKKNLGIYNYIGIFKDSFIELIVCKFSFFLTWLKRQ